MRIVITCGPASEPIDRVRRITNFSTGELGILLANRLARDGHEVTVFKGEGATCPITVQGGEVVMFTTNYDLLERLKSLPDRSGIASVFHAAALCDFKIAQVLDERGAPIAAAKIPSATSHLQIVLVPAPKVIASLRELFPNSRIVGWKYELDGTRDEAIAKAVQQIAANRTDACVVNGAAYGDGFGFCEDEKLVTHLAGKQQLCDFLAEKFGR
jgi:phosphopantothenoylcysteine decarboxylase/phosphopantothenate--cysteine ligase